MKRVIAVAALAVALAGIPALGAAARVPHEIISTTVNQLIDQMEQNREEFRNDRRRLYEMVSDLVVPHFDVERIARLVLARHWREATAEQREKFTREFQTLMIRTYSTALFEYTGREEMTVQPANVQDGDDRTVVRTEVKLPDTAPIPVNYSFVHNDDGTWKIYDINIDGVSWVINYRSSYDPIIQQRGLDGLISELAGKNAKLGQ
jgi:phospholipid transport system substrate-binding protein